MNFIMTVRRDTSLEKYALAPNRGRRIKGKTKPQESDWSRNSIGKNGLVPNFTTSGYGLTPELAAVCRKYCGAVAASWYRSTYTQNAIRMFLDAGVKTNIHYVLGKNSIDEAIERLKGDDFPSGQRRYLSPS